MAKVIKMKDLLKESTWDTRKFGEKLPTIQDYQDAYNKKNNIEEAKSIDSREWKKIKYDIGDQIDDLVKVGEDYGVFQSAKHTSKTLKKIQKLWKSLS